MPEWTDRLAGARMQVDQQFQDRVLASRFSNQQWGLIMTAVEWDVYRPQDPEDAQLVADTEHLPDIIPELDRIQNQMGGPAGPGSGGGGGGIASRLKQLFGSLSAGPSGSDHQEQLTEAEKLVDEYARELQAFLEKHERWEEIRTAAAESEAE